MSILLTIDVEDYFQVENLRPFFPLHTWNRCDLRVETNTFRLLDLFDCHKVKATFFVLGWIAEHCPGLVREIRNRGHEVASHGYHHRITSELSRAELREDLYRSKALLEDITGEPVLGYRAPKFMISKDLLELLPEIGFRYDSSLNSFSSKRPLSHSQDNSFAHSFINSLTCSYFNSALSPLNSVLSPECSSVYEIPVSNLQISRWVIPMGGGGYFRFWPGAWFEKGAARILRSEGRYVFYIHPWEIDAGQPRVEKVAGLRRFRHYLNLDKTLDRLDHFLGRFKDNSFLSCTEYMQRSRESVRHKPSTSWRESPENRLNTPQAHHSMNRVQVRGFS